MSRHQVLTLVLIVAISTTAAGQNLVRNGGFTTVAPRIGDGSIPPNRVAEWSSAYATPQFIPGKGCEDDNYIAMWGNRVAGEALAQTVAMRKGVMYEVSLCARYRNSNIPYAHVELRASAGPLRDPTCPANTCETIGGAKNVTVATWAPYRFRFTPLRDYTTVTVSTTNDIAVNDGAFVSWAEVDNISISPVEGGGLAPLINMDTPSRIRDQYVLVLERNATRAEVARVEEAFGRLDVTVLHRYTGALLGFGIKAPPSALPTLRSLPRVAWIEADQLYMPHVVQMNPPKGLDRTSERPAGLDNRFTYSENGTGVHVYVLDTGIRASHNDFGGRVSGGFTAISDAWGTGDCTGSNLNWPYGHGTHVAGTIGGTIHGIAKNVQIHPVRVFPCGAGGPNTNIIAGIDWVTNNRILPAVANMSLGGGASLSLDTAVNNSIASGVTYVVSAGNSNADTCNVSPARVPAAITVGSINPVNDTRAGDSNWGTCVDLFGPGVGIVSASHTSNTGTQTMSGTSMAAPHVAGVAALYLDDYPSSNPTAVWGRIQYVADIFGTTPGWPGIVNGGPGSPNVLLHWGSLNDGYDDGDPHLTTVDGVHYNFQSAGEFVLLRDAGVEIQTRQTPIATTFDPGPDPYDDLATCVALNTAVAARVGPYRITYQPSLSGVPDPSGMQLRVDGMLVPLTAAGLPLSGGGRVAKTPVGDGLQIEFPGETILTAVPGWWADQGKWYLNVHVTRTRAQSGIMGRIARGSWLPALPDGSSLGPMPALLHDRYVQLNQTFANAWRVTSSSSLFDYAPGTSTTTFTLASWPREKPPCTLPNTTPVKPVELSVAQNACAAVTGERAKSDCVFDVRVTGEVGFAKTYLISEKIRAGATVTTIADSTPAAGATVFTATVIPAAANGRGVPAGFVQFSLDGTNAGEPVRLDSAGRATWRPANVPAGTHVIVASYSPDWGVVFLPSRSADLAASFGFCPPRSVATQ